MRNILLGIFAVLVIGGAIAGAAYLTKPEVQNVTTDEHVSTPSKATETYTIEVDGVDREFIVYRPDNLPADEAVPVVFMFHGGGQNGKIFYQDSGWRQKADEEGFMAVFPTALKYHTYADSKVKNGKVVEDVAEYKTSWVGANIDSKLDPNYPDQVVHQDIEFVNAMVDFLKNNYAVDSDHFYASGFSNGAGFVNYLMIEATNIFAAFAGNSSGGLSTEGSHAVSDERPDDFVARPSIILIGSEDPKLTYGSSQSLGIEVKEFATDESAAEEGNPVRVRYIDLYLDILELTDAYSYEKEGRLSHFTFSEPISGADSTAEFNLYIVEGMKHVYPNGDNFPITAVDIYWPFFEQYSR